MTEYAELHAHSGFSFLDGSSDPEELVAEADRLGLAALALTDHHGFYGVVRFAEAARVCGLPTVFGTEVTLAPAGLRTGEPDPTGAHLVVLARDPEGYAAPVHRAGRRASRGRGEGEADLHPRRAGRRRGGPLAGAQWVSEGGGPRRADGSRAQRGRQRSRTPRRRLRARQRRPRAVGPRRPDRRGAQRRAGAPGRRVGGRRRRHQQRALRHAGRVPPRHHARRRAGAPPPGRARGLAAAGPGGVPALRRRAEPALRPLARRRRAGRRARARLRVRPPPGGAAAARLPRPRRHDRAGLPAPPGARGGAGPLRAAGVRAGAGGVEADRARARRDRHARLRRLLPRRVGHRAGVQAAEHLLPGPWLGGQLRRLLRARRHQRRLGRPRAVVRALLVAGT